MPPDPTFPPKRPRTTDPYNPKAFPDEEGDDDRFREEGGVADGGAAGGGEGGVQDGGADAPDTHAG